MDQQKIETAIHPENEREESCNLQLYIRRRNNFNINTNQIHNEKINEMKETCFQ